MSQQNKQSIKQISPNLSTKKESPLLSAELEQKVVHLQTLLMLTQLNSTYYQLKLSTKKAATNIGHVFMRIKMNAFLSIKSYRHGLVELNRMRDCFEQRQRKQRIAKISDDIDFSFSRQDDLDGQFENYKKTANYQQFAANTVVKCQSKLERLAQIIHLKKKGMMSFAVYRLENHREVIANQIYSQKSSKIETNDSHKSKIFRRSVQKRQNRKSFSLEKSGLIPKHELYVPIKYQPSRASSQLSANSQKKTPANNSQISSMLNRFLQNIGDKSKERRKNLQIGYEKKQIKCSSTKRYNSSLQNQERQEKIQQLQYLRRKYKKLIDQFSWFSERFLKVIEEEEYVQ